MPCLPLLPYVLLAAQAVTTKGGDGFVPFEIKRVLGWSSLRGMGNPQPLSLTSTSGVHLELLITHRSGSRAKSYAKTEAANPERVRALKFGGWVGKMVLVVRPLTKPEMTD